jgi:putative acetyltransferase
MFSPVRLDGHAQARLMGLAPMAVLPSHQRRSVGSALIRGGLDACRRLGAQAVVVLGHPSYYPRFGFAPADRSGIRCEFDAPDEAFMLLELTPGAVARIEGTARYHPAFRDL